MRFLIAAVFLLVALPASAEPIETYDATGGKDFAPAFERAQLFGVTVELGPGVYPLKRPVSVCRGLAVVGQGVGFSQASSQITTLRSTAFRVLAKADGCPIAGLTAADSSLRLEHVTVINKGSISLAGELPFYGVEAHRPILLYDVAVRGFVHGVDLTCDTSRGTNCNGAKLFAVDIDQSEHAGLYLQGNCANAGSFVSVRADSNCSQALAWNDRFLEPFCGNPNYKTHAVCTQQKSRCAGIFDGSQLGNTFVGSQTATERQIFPRGSVPFDYAGIIAVGANQDTTIVGGYIEGNAWPGSTADGRVTVVGGSSNGANGGAVIGGAAGQLHGFKMPALEITNALDGVSPVAIKMGFATGLKGTVWRATKGAESAGWATMIDPSGALTLTYRNSMPLGVMTPPK